MRLIGDHDSDGERGICTSDMLDETMIEMGSGWYITLALMLGKGTFAP